MSIRNFTFVAFCLAVSSFGLTSAALLAEEAPARPEEPAFAPRLERIGLIKGLQGSYISIVRRGGEFQFFANCIGESTPGLVMFKGSSPGEVGPPELVAPNDLIDDLPDPAGKPDPSRMFTRPVVRFSEKEQLYYAVVHVARGYPPSDGCVYPALLVSKTADPAKGWTYKGRFKGEPAKQYGLPERSWTSGMAFILNDKHGDAVDHANPMGNKFVLYNEFGGGLKLLYSNDGSEWFFYRDGDRKIVDMMPKEFQESDGSWIFSSAVRTPEGYFMYVSYKWMQTGPAGHRFLFSKDGLSWTQIQALPPGPKNYSIAYDADKKLLYVMPTTVGSLPYAKELFTMDTKQFEGWNSKK